MPLNHAEVAKQRRPLNISFGELGSLKVVYDPSQITPDFYQGLADRAEEPKSIGGAWMIATVVHEWDYNDEKGKPFELQEPVLRKLPALVIDKVVEEVFKDLNPPPTPSDSSASSF